MFFERSLCFSLLSIGDWVALCRKGLCEEN